MPVRAVIGTQFGDEGKGKIVDFLSENADIVVRYAGGGNAGHTVVNRLGTFKARIVPVGMFTETVRLCVIGRGTVPDVRNIIDELKICAEKKIDVNRLMVDSSAHLIMPWHIAEDRLLEEAKGDGKIGTTGNGIGPCYSDKILRRNLRAGDLLNFEVFEKRFIKLKAEKRAYLLGQYSEHFENCASGCLFCEPMGRTDSEDIAEFKNHISCLANWFGGLENLICDTLPVLWNAVDNNERILLEGAQGALLSIDGGSYPYVTSSNTGAASASQGSGIPPNKIREVIGVAKAYMSRVGNGLFPTRMAPKMEKKMREHGKEYGTVTGRPRNCGWFDAPALERVLKENGITYLAITLLDILDHAERIGIGNGYNCIKSGDEGICFDAEHMLRSDNPKAAITYIDGWGPDKTVRGCKDLDSLPENEKRYIEFIEKSCGRKIKIISTGAAREDTIVIY